MKYISKEWLIKRFNSLSDIYGAKYKESQSRYYRGRELAYQVAADIIDTMSKEHEIEIDEKQFTRSTENMSTIGFCDRFICKNCDIRLEDWNRVQTEEYEDGYKDYVYPEYRFKFCPECGAKIKNNYEG